MSKTNRVAFIKKDKDDWHSDRVVMIVPESIAKKGGNELFQRKLTPYIKKHLGMYNWGRNKWSISEPYSTDLKTRVRGRTGIGARQSAKNYNRSLKKAVRQQYKKEIAKELQSL